MVVCWGVFMRCSSASRQTANASPSHIRSHLLKLLGSTQNGTCFVSRVCLVDERHPFHPCRPNANLVFYAWQWIEKMLPTVSSISGFPLSYPISVPLHVICPISPQTGGHVTILSLSLFAVGTRVRARSHTHLWCQLVIFANESTGNEYLMATKYDILNWNLY